MIEIIIQEKLNKHRMIEELTVLHLVEAYTCTCNQRLSMCLSSGDSSLVHVCTLLQLRVQSSECEALPMVELFSVKLLKRELTIQSPFL